MPDDVLPAEEPTVPLTPEEQAAKDAADAQAAQLAADTASGMLGARVTSLWDAANSWAAQIDSNERHRYNAWLADPASSADKKALIFDQIRWSDSIFMSYYDRKTRVMEGGPADTDFSSLGRPPHTFAEIYGTP